MESQCGEYDITLYDLVISLSPEHFKKNAKTHDLPTLSPRPSRFCASLQYSKFEFRPSDDMSS